VLIIICSFHAGAVFQHIQPYVHTIKIASDSAEAQQYSKSEDKEMEFCSSKDSGIYSSAIFRDIGINGILVSMIT